MKYFTLVTITTIVAFATAHPAAQGIGQSVVACSRICAGPSLSCSGDEFVQHTGDCYTCCRQS
ncbi:hypothetical protein COCSADRAFT_37228 [Bipolaris sorokiniana ND90Pr]|uniref:Uncharacterized protein n=1 Tax=Cochliobolus sativus (strain ND90Pr / ATCC 201652) TaxID=665912 RepID=M2S821_COCSN|nr:uncharacterized protein COCSADRAFT_37228 [Bipolaris sorokiniana ND90Pr]EMD63443.1 hypothetical protein COCSADRAFT_37228 [Bipolaris sorokiniana ND90Pr]